MPGLASANLQSPHPFSNPGARNMFGMYLCAGFPAPVPVASLCFESEGGWEVFRRRHIESRRRWSGRIVSETVPILGCSQWLTGIDSHLPWRHQRIERSKKENPNGPRTGFPERPVTVFPVSMFGRKTEDDSGRLLALGLAHGGVHRCLKIGPTTENIQQTGTTGPKIAVKPDALPHHSKCFLTNNSSISGAR